jgi:hypothetical protein
MILEGFRDNRRTQRGFRDHGGGALASDGEGANSRDEQQRKFREALERKRAREAEAGGARGRGGTGKIHGPQGPARSRRTFRRKSGG